MEKMMLTKPMAVAEQFMPNEYIAACWRLGCDVRGFEDGLLSPYHDRNDCGNETHQYIVLVPGTENVYKITEYKDGQHLSTVIYPNGNYVSGQGTNTIVLDGSVVGRTVYWTTRYNFITYHHEGDIGYQDPDHPLRS